MSDSETFAALLAAGLDRGAAGSGPHTVAEPVTAFATTHFWLIGTFHEWTR